jgi:hypothetical protein
MPKPILPNKMKATRTIDKIICDLDSKYGAPMGRDNIGKRPTGKRIFDCAVPLSEGYDKGGAYWGNPSDLRVAYTQDMEYIEFYRTSDRDSELAKEFNRRRILKTIKPILGRYTYEQRKAILWVLTKEREENMKEVNRKLEEYYLERPAEILDSYLLLKKKKARI